MENMMQKLKKKNPLERLRNKRGKVQSHIHVLEKAQVEQVFSMRE